MRTTTPSPGPRGHGRFCSVLVLASLGWPPVSSLAAAPTDPDTLGKPRSAATRLAPASPLADPTRPPAFALPASPASSAARGAGPALAKAPEPLAPPPAVLQALQVPARGTATAVVDGRLVQAGDTVDGHLVLAIDNQGLVLRTPHGNDRLWLLGGSPKQAPGSILITRTASFVPAPQPAESPTTDVANPAAADRATPTTAKAAPPRNLSLAGSN